MESIQSISQKSPASWEERQVNVLAENRIPNDGLAVSEEEYWEHYYDHPDFHYEWNDGHLEAKPMADLKGSEIYQWFTDILRCYMSTYSIGKIVNLEIGFRLELPDKVCIRVPDMSVVLDENDIVIDQDDCTYSGIFDLCIESLSYSSIKEIRRDTVQKKGEYESIGVKEYYILDARKIETAFYGLNKNGKYESIVTDDDIVRSAVLPGFQFRISDLYKHPALKKLSEDELYSKYVYPFYNEEKQRAELSEKMFVLEKQHADQEKQRADQEKQRAERLAAKLRELGISPD